jgi:hemoglobin/transferrin/lactoferrin receptor protein
MPGNYWRFTAVASSGFRAPNVDDISKVFESTPGNVIVPNPSLKPEYTYNFDLGISKGFSDIVTIGGTGFYTLYKNAITTQPALFGGTDSIFYSGQLSRVTMAVNANEAYIYGFNAFLVADVTENFSINNSINYTFGRIVTDTVDYPLDHIPPVFGKSSFVYKHSGFRSEFYVYYNGTKASWNYNLFGEDNEANSADPVNGYMPAWVTFNLRASYQFTRHLQAQVAVENLLDEHYRVFASNISAPGRNFIVSLRARF